jgi:hypothetical protein
MSPIRETRKTTTRWTTSTSTLMLGEAGYEREGGCCLVGLPRSCVRSCLGCFGFDLCCDLRNWQCVEAAAAAEDRGGFGVRGGAADSVVGDGVLIMLGNFVFRSRGWSMGKRITSPSVTSVGRRARMEASGPAKQVSFGLRVSGSGPRGLESCGCSVLRCGSCYRRCCVDFFGMMLRAQVIQMR